MRVIGLGLTLLSVALVGCTTRVIIALPSGTPTAAITVGQAQALEAMATVAAQPTETPAQPRQRPTAIPPAPPAPASAPPPTAAPDRVMPLLPPPPALTPDEVRARAAQFVQDNPYLLPAGGESAQIHCGPPVDDPLSTYHPDTQLWFIDCGAVVTFSSGNEPYIPSRLVDLGTFIVEDRTGVVRR
ncbi:MAG: hypothetical protein KGK07_12825 [Chloroflexota bacterium]|nr:hypothetical protein [Chloroflexota bacterium]